MTRSFFPGRPRRERGIYVSSANNRPISLDFLNPFRRGLAEFEKITESAGPDDKEFKGFSKLELRECATKYLLYVDIEDELFPSKPSGGRFVHGPISSTPKLKKGTKPPIRNLTLHFEEITPTNKISENVEADNTKELYIPVKRGRGRPPKLKSTKEVTSAINQVKKEPKKRGRKRKLSPILEENNDRAESHNDDKKNRIWKSVVNVVDEFLHQQLKKLQFSEINDLKSLELLMDQTKSLAARCTSNAR